MTHSFKKKERVAQLLVHLSIWLAYIAYESLMRYFLAGLGTNLVEVLSIFSLNAWIFYVFALVLLPKFYQKKKYLLLVSSYLLTLGLFVLFRYLLLKEILPVVTQDFVFAYKTLRQFLAEAIWRGTYFTILGFGYWFALSMINTEKEKRKLEVKRANYERRMREAEKELRIAQLEYLRTQINPHFLFNTLNHFYEQVISSSEKTAEGILLLSHIMRYALKENKTNAKALLVEEVEHLQNFIAIYQLRFNQRLQVKFEVSGVIDFRMILPLVLITFVENCFKYGDLFDPAHPLTIQLQVKEDELSFYTHNKKKLSLGEVSNGIGIGNTRKRLDLAYGDQYSLDLLDEQEFFTTNLKIKL